MTLRSDMPRAGRWVAHVLALPVLGTMGVGSIGCLLAPPLELLGIPWIDHPLFRAGVAAFLLGVAVCFSAQLSQAVSRAELDGTTLTLTGLLGRRLPLESLCNVKAIHGGGLVEFAGGRKLHLGDHPRILQEIRWWHANGFRHPSPGDPPPLNPPPSW